MPNLLMPTTALLLPSQPQPAGAGTRLDEANVAAQHRLDREILESEESGPAAPPWADAYAAAFYSAQGTRPAQALDALCSLHLGLHDFRAIGREDVIRVAWTTNRLRDADYGACAPNWTPCARNFATLAQATATPSITASAAARTWSAPACRPTDPPTAHTKKREPKLPFFSRQSWP